MDEEYVRKCWDANADAWTEMARAGYDTCRDRFNTPCFMRTLGPVDGARLLDIGCGEGHNTRLLARRGAKVSALDLSHKFIRYAREAEECAPLGIDYRHGTAAELPYEDEVFDVCTAFMSFQDMPRQREAFAEAHRVLKCKGVFQFSILHPCFQTPFFRWIRDDNGRKIAIQVGGYFDRTPCEEQWTFGAASDELQKKHGKFRTPYFEHTLSKWFEMVTEAGFTVTKLAEPTVDDETLAKHPEEYDSRVIAMFLIMKCIKGTSNNWFSAKTSEAQPGEEDKMFRRK